MIAGLEALAGVQAEPVALSRDLRLIARATVRALAVDVVLAEHLVEDRQRNIDLDVCSRSRCISASARPAKRWNISPLACQG